MYCVDNLISLFCVLQQKQVLTELYSYIHQDPEPSDVATTIETHKYLEACNLIFERQFLCPWIGLWDGFISVEEHLECLWLFFSMDFKFDICRYIILILLVVFFQLVLNTDKSFAHTSNIKKKAFCSWQSKWCGYM